MPYGNSLKQVQHDDVVCKTGLPRHCVARNDGDVTTRFFGLRPLNDGRTMLNDQNGLTVMSSRSSINEKSKVKPETKCNQIQNKLWQKQSNRNKIGKMHNDQNGLVLMFGSSKQHMAQETKPDFDRNMIEREVA